jgi:hypothetical protein
VSNKLTFTQVSNLAKRLSTLVAAHPVHPLFINKAGLDAVDVVSTL